MSLENPDNQSASASAWLDEFQKSAAEELITNFGILTAVQVDHTLPAWSVWSGDRLHEVVPLPAVAIGLSLFVKSESAGFLVFDRQDAIWVGTAQGIRSEGGQPEEPASELGEEDKETFAEVCRQLIGSLERAARNGSPDAAVQPGDAVLLWDSPGDSEFSDAENYVLIPIQADLEDRGPIVMTILLATSAVDELMDKQTDWPALVVEGDAAKTPSSAASYGTNTLLLRLKDQTASEIEMLLQDQAVSYACVSNYLELRRLLREQDIRLLVIEGQDQEELGIKLCRLIRERYLDESNAAIWLQGRSWNRKKVHLAWQAGAAYCITSPVDRDLVGEKIRTTLES